MCSQDPTSFPYQSPTTETAEELQTSVRGILAGQVVALLRKAETAGLTDA